LRFGLLPPLTICHIGALAGDSMRFYHTVRGKTKR
jgi:hypothetical protein